MANHSQWEEERMPVEMRSSSHFFYKKMKNRGLNRENWGKRRLLNRWKNTTNYFSKKYIQSRGYSV